MSAPRFEDVSGVGMSFSRMTLIFVLLMCILLFVYLLNRTPGGAGSGVLSLLEEVERLQLAEKVLSQQGDEDMDERDEFRREHLPPVQERDLTE